MELCNQIEITLTKRPQLYYLDYFQGTKLGVLINKSRADINTGVD